MGNQQSAPDTNLTLGVVSTRMEEPLWKLATDNNYNEIDRITSTGEGRARLNIELDEVM